MSKPFDLEAAKRGEAVQTTDGKKARIVCYDRNHSGEYENFSLLVLMDLGRYESLVACNSAGKDVYGKQVLVMAPKVVYVNFYKNGAAYHYNTEEEAVRFFVAESKDVLAKAVKVELP